MKLKGKAHKFGDNINTDEIIPARYLNTIDPKVLGAHCMEDADTDFVKKVKKGDIIVGGRNFGCGSSREHAPLSIKACGVSCVIAESFARIFYRNAINTGLPILESKLAADSISQGDVLEIDLKKGSINNTTANEEYDAQAFPEFMERIIKAGGLMNYVKRRIKQKCTR
ncbi:MAG: 3-isopropylmalate dehydratase small subunit [Candidatus Omnitrophica bacterium]|nr:3-isopropylmalate dehydratase small subunit [Candidatus Omnitrophota bacterium]